MGIAKRSHSGQMTVELAVAFPVLLVVAVISVNALAFFSDCAAFDRIAHQAVRVHASAPAYRQGAEQTRSLVEQEISASFDKENLDVAVTHETIGFDFEAYTATLSFTPTLFGMGLRSEVLGVPLPKLVHATRCVVDTYKAGVIV